MHVVIDGKEIAVEQTDKNIVDVADRAGVGIPAPCYRSGNRRVCCRVCVVEADSKQVYACCTSPQDGMQITVYREDLERLRAERIRQYRTSSEPEQACECTCGCESGTSAEGCC